MDIMAGKVTSCLQLSRNFQSESKALGKETKDKMKTIGLFSIMLVAFTVNAQEEKLCECGVFKETTPTKTTFAPLIVKSPSFPINCKLDGKETCAKMCNALAEASKDKAPNMLCQMLSTTIEPFTPSIYSRACGDEEWTHTGLTANHVQVCCVNQTPITCPEPVPMS